MVCVKTTIPVLSLCVKTQRWATQGRRTAAPHTTFLRGYQTQPKRLIKNTLLRRFRNFNQLNSSEPASNWSHR